MKILKILEIFESVWNLAAFGGKKNFAPRRAQNYAEKLCGFQKSRNYAEIMRNYAEIMRNYAELCGKCGIMRNYAELCGPHNLPPPPGGLYLNPTQAQ